MARTKGSKNKSKAQGLPIDPVNDNSSLLKRDRGAGLRAYRERKKAEKELAMAASHQTGFHSHKKHVVSLTVAGDVHDTLVKKIDPIVRIRELLNSNDPKKCYLIVEF